MICKYCNSEIDDESLYCPFCGNKVVIDQKDAAKEKPKKKIKILLPAVILCVAAVVFLGIGVLNKGSKGDTPEAASVSE